MAKTKDEIAEAYSSTPTWYDIRGYFVLIFAYNVSLSRIVSFFGKNIGKKHLEVAIGTGTLLELILDWRTKKKLTIDEIFGMDYAQSMLDGAKNRFKNHPNITLSLEDVGDMNYEDNSFDTINVANAVHCFPEPQKGFDEMFRVLKKDGTIYANILLHPRTIFPFNLISKRVNKFGVKK